MWRPCLTLQSFGCSTDHLIRGCAAIAAACAAVAILIFVLFRDLRHDDAYITFQYARNLAEGHGFVFNDGERILGTTTPLFTLILAAVYRVAGDVLPHAAIAISAVCLPLQGVLLWLLLRERARYTAAAIAIATALGFGGAWGNLSLETCLYCTLVLATIVAAARKRELIAGLCLGLAFLTRYDAGLLVLVVVGWVAIERRSVPIRTLLVSLVVVAPWLVFAKVYFGSIMPHTLGAKTGMTSPGTYLAHYRDLGLSLFRLDEFWFGSTIGVGCMILGLRWIWLEARSLVPLVVYAIGHALVYAWIGPSELQHWHMYVPVLVMRVLIVLGVIGTLERRSVAAVITCGVFVVGTTAFALARNASTYRESYWGGLRHSRYEEVARWLEVNVAPRASLLSTEVGTLGYLTRRRMIDPAGLVTETNDWPRSLRIEDKLELVRRTSADVVLFDTVEEAKRAELLLGYRLVHVFPWLLPWSAVCVRDVRVLTTPPP